MSTRRISRTKLRRDSANQTFARSTIIQVARKDSTSRQIDHMDEWSLPGVAGAFIIPTPYPVSRLFELIEQSNILGPCIEAYVVNTAGTGWELTPVVRGGKMNESERVELESFVENPNTEESLSTLMGKVIRDRESVGFGFIEGIRDSLGRLSILRHAPSLITRVGHKHPTPQLVEYEVARGRRVSVVKEFRKFRKFVQLLGGEQIWFKEWGDPRTMDRVTGMFEGEPGYVPNREATEIYHVRLPSSDAYGVPRWISQLPSIVGSREAEEVNMRYFEDNTVPPMMLTVSGGRLTRNSFNELTKMLSAEAVGKRRQNKIMLVEAVGDTDSLDKNGSPVQLKIEKLTDVRQSDGLFDAYDKANQGKVRQSWRMPGILLGQGDDKNFANAQVSVFLADSQVFDPGRCDIDEILNKCIVAAKHGLNIKSVKLTSRIPAISSPETTIKTLTALNVMGAVTPRSAQILANTILQMELPEYPQKGEEGYEEWMDLPLPLQKTSKTHDEQASKTEAIKKLEATGEVQFTAPEKGHEGEVITE